MTNRVVVGQIGSARGVKGEVKVYPLMDDPDFFSRLEEVWVEGGDHPGEPRRIVRLRPQKEAMLVQLEGITTRTEAEALAGLKLSVPRTELPVLEEGLYYHFQLEGLSVETEEGLLLGNLDHVMETGSNDVYVVRTPRGKDLLLPATHQVIRSIDIDAGIIVVSPLEGMLDDE